MLICTFSLWYSSNHFKVLEKNSFDCYMYANLAVLLILRPFFLVVLMDFALPCPSQKFVAGLWYHILSSTLPKFIFSYGSSTCLFLFLLFKNALIKLNLPFYQIKYESTIELYKKKLGKE